MHVICMKLSTGIMHKWLDWAYRIADFCPFVAVDVASVMHMSQSDAFLVEHWGAMGKVDS